MTALPKQGNNILINNKEENTMSKTSIGLDKKASEKLAAKLNELLATYQVFYTNVRGYHWNIKGVNFFELHAKFEEIYTDLVEKIDEDLIGGFVIKAKNKVVDTSIRSQLQTFKTNLK